MTQTHEKSPSDISECELSVVIPVFNEESVVLVFLDYLRRVLDLIEKPYEVILVDDGSSDQTWDVVSRISWAELRVAKLASNVGHQAAIDAGLSLARGAWIVTMDGDGQHPPEAIPRMIQVAESQGVDVVYGVRESRDLDKTGKRLVALAYYRVIRWLTNVPLTDSQADYRLMSSRVLTEVERVPGDRVLRLLLPAIGFESATVNYESQPRIGGNGRFGLTRQIALATSSILNFSSKPLKLVAGLGTLISVAALLWLAYVLVAFLSNKSIEGWASVMAAVLFVGGLTLLSISIIGSYIARIHDILKARPRYFIDRVSEYPKD